MQRNGKVVLGLNFGRRVGVVRLNRHGSRDRSFGRRGRAVSRVVGKANAVAVAPGGRILVAGEQDGKFLIAGFVG